LTKPLDKLICDHKTRRQQKGMPDRWRLLEKLDPCQFVVLRRQDGNVEYSSAVFVRRSEVEKLREEYGENMEVL